MWFCYPLKMETWICGTNFIRLASLLISFVKPEINDIMSRIKFVIDYTVVFTEHTNTIYHRYMGTKIHQLPPRYEANIHFEKTHKYWNLLLAKTCLMQSKALAQETGKISELKDLEFCSVSDRATRNAFH